MQTPAIFAGPADTPDCSETVDSFLRVAHSLRSLISTEMNELDLNEIRHAVLCFLQKQPGGCSQRVLADELGQTESSISTLLRRMSGDGLICKTQSATDARQRVLSLTERGEELATRAAGRFRQLSAQLLKGMSEDDHRSLDATVEHIAKSMQRMNETEKFQLTISRPEEPAPTKSTSAANDITAPSPASIGPSPDVISAPLPASPPAASSECAPEQPRRAA